MTTEIIVNPNTFTFQAKRIFHAPLALVWRAYTEPALLDQWWAPKPWKAETQSMDFTPGGKWIYDMVGPNGERHGAMQIFKEIVFEKYFSGIDAFVDEHGKINESMPVATWKNTFEAVGDQTLVTVYAQYPNKESLEFVIKMGMDKGVSMAHDNLSELLNKIK
ncbi:MAG: hypothetical protein KatS3mg032_1991 [Cyclobacteriaceae bacterium]|nr:MAG: hypothetical protein KatS3mg032_1991 [Cyclobacteriaceae bacterium]